ncbi:efflux RND transporter permease subunit [Paradevosia shaoguanensis]|uniref:MMPL family transporter n=1 Tax=Paradevosia shaoguanensis TaxID=1335043 RepID=A0AA41QLJ9_9HYPH|nr:MMPL family transporter [Paradevosia shaoguanensis]MCI0127095.1 MMPL family transporter [Paradevosia shaoguanensis]
MIALTVLAASQIPRANVDGDLMRIFAHSGEDYDAYAQLSNTFGTFENDIYFLVTSPDVTDPDVLEALRNFAFDLELNDFAVGTMSPFTLRKPTDNGGSVPAVPEGMSSREEVAAALSDLQQNDPLMRNLITPDLTGIVMIMFPNQELTRGDGNKEMIAQLRDLASQYESDKVHIELTGPPMWTAEMLYAAVNDQVTFTVYGFALGALIALLSLRSFWGAILVSATPFLAVTWVTGIVLLFFGSFSFLTIIVTTLVLVIAFAESLFFIFNWIAYWRDGMDPYKAVDTTVKVVGPASALTMLTTLISFASLALTPGQGIQEFSVTGAIASLLNFVCLMTFLPLVLKLAIRLGFKIPPKSSIVLTAPMRVSWFLAKRFSRALATAAIALTVVLFIPYFLVEPRFAFEDFVAKDSLALDAATEIDAGVGGVAPIYVRVPLIDAAPEMTDADFETVRKIHEIVEKHLGQNKVISAASFSHYQDSGFTRQDVLDSVGAFMKRRFITEDGKQALVTGFMPTIIASEDLRRLVDDLHAEIDAAGIKGTEIGGFRILATFATENIVQGLQLDLTVSVLVNLFLIGFAFRSLRVATATAIPNLFPVLGAEAFLWWSGAGLQLTTVLSLTIAFGIAVDDTTHFLSHYLHARREEGRDHNEAVKHTMERIGGAIVATTLILCSGTGIVATSNLPQVALFGTLFVITLALALIGDVFILPALLVAGGKFFHPLGGIRK